MPKMGAEYQIKVFVEVNWFPCVLISNHFAIKIFMTSTKDNLMTSLKSSSMKLSLLSTACLLALTPQVYAQNLIDTTQDLGSVLNQFATVANVEIMFSPQLVSNQTTSTPDISGAPRSHLVKILSGTGLTFKEPSQNVFIITEANDIQLPGNSGGISTAAVSTANISQTSTQVSPQNSIDNASQPNRIDRDAAPGAISGQVLDEFSGQPLAGAIVSLGGTKRTVATDTRGFYRFSAAPVGEYSISVSYLGSETQSHRVGIVSGEPITRNFSLASHTEVIVVQGSRSSLQQALNQQLAADNSATVVSSDLLGSFPAETIAEALRRVSGVSFSRDAATGVKVIVSRFEALTHRPLISNLTA